MSFKNLIKRIIPKPVLNWRHFFYAWRGAVKYHHPSEEMMVIGITGTSGKSSTIHFLRQILEAGGFKVGSLSTVDFYVDGQLQMNDKKMTMVGKYFIQEKLREMADKKCDLAIVETTSEGYLQHRHRFINYDLMALTNLYPEHIEAHGSFENYQAAKLGIFEYVSKCARKNLKIERLKDCEIKTEIVNGECEFAEEFLGFGFERKIRYQIADNRYQNHQSAITNHQSQPSSQSELETKVIMNLESANLLVDAIGLHFDIDSIHFDAPLFGEHNISNLTCAIAIARSLNLDWTVIQQAIKVIQPPPGRIEFINESEKFGFKVIVDYAFEPVALESLYKVVELLSPKRVIHVCGSTGGGRDKSRREPIGRLVGEKAEVFIVTDEDPYEEDPTEIIKTVSKGAQESGKVLGKDLFEILDRKEAIKKALEMAQKGLPGAARKAETGDLILITGKGSEQKMCVKEGKMIDWDDREIVREILMKLKEN